MIPSQSSVREPPTFSDGIHVSFDFDCHKAGMKIIRAFLADETGATTIIPVVNGLGVKLNAKFTPINTSLK
jgi:hypothetical protein